MLKVFVFSFLVLNVASTFAAGKVTHSFLITDISTTGSTCDEAMTNNEKEVEKRVKALGPLFEDYTVKVLHHLEEDGGTCYKSQNLYYVSSQIELSKN